MLMQSKINETKDLMKKKAMEIEKSKMEAAKHGRGGGGSEYSRFFCNRLQGAVLGHV